jgi:hypothetical protein
MLIHDPIANDAVDESVLNVKCLPLT